MSGQDEETVTVNWLLERIEAMEELDRDARIGMFVTLFDLEQLADECKKQAIMQSIGLATTSQVHSFAYGILRLARPDLLEPSDG